MIIVVLQVAVGIWADVNFDSVGINTNSMNAYAVIVVCFRLMKLLISVFKVLTSVREIT